MKINSLKICTVVSSRCKLGKLARLLAWSLAMLDYSNILEGRALDNKNPIKKSNYEAETF